MSEKKQFDLESTDKTKLRFTLSAENNTIVLVADGVDNKTLKYEASFTKENLNNASKIFKIDANITENLPILAWCFAENKVVAQKLEDSLDLTFAPKAFYLQDFHLSLKKMTILDAVGKIGKQIMDSDIGGKINEGKQKIEEQFNKGLSGLKNFFG